MTNEYAYRGIVARSYNFLLPPDEIDDHDFFRREILDEGQPALEIGCGTGRLLLSYLGEGLDLEGVDVSPEMLAICKRKALAAKLAVRLHQQAMERLDLSRRYRTIYVPAGSLMLLTDRRDATSALNCFHRHLEPGGKAVIPLDVTTGADLGTESTPPGTWRLRRQGTRPEDGATIHCWDRSSYDSDEPIQRLLLRYEVIKDGRVMHTEETALPLRWYTRTEFSVMLADAGFSDIRILRGHSREPAHSQDDELIFVARRTS